MGFSWARRNVLLCRFGESAPTVVLERFIALRKVTLCCLLCEGLRLFFSCCFLYEVMRLEGATAVITGGQQGIGLALGKELLAAGANVCALDLGGGERATSMKSLATQSTASSRGVFEFSHIL